MSTIMLDIYEVHSPACASTISVVSSKRIYNLTSKALSKLPCCSEVPSPLFYTMDPTMSSTPPINTSTSISCSEALSLKTFSSLSTSLDIDKPYNRKPVDCTYSPEAHSSVCSSTKSAKVSESPTEIDMYESPSQLALALLNSPALPKPRTIIMMSLQYEDPASKWHKMESIIRMPPLLYASARLYDLYKKVLASKWPEFCLAKPRSILKVISASELHKICLASPRSIYKIKPSSRTSLLKFSSSMCLMDPRLQTPVPDVHEVSTPGRA